MSAKILHTSDWHLGKKLFKESRIPEQKLFLDWLLEKIVSENIEVLILAGDVFDSPTPPTDALRLFYNFINDLIEKSDCYFFILGGNHDSGKFLEAPIKALKARDRVIIKGHIQDSLTSPFVKLKINKKKIGFFLLPFFRTYEILNLAQELGVAEEDQDALFLQTIRTYIAQYQEDLKDCTYNFLIAHHLFGSFEYSGSEQNVNLSGLESLSPAFFDQFDYLALGHIHKRQIVSSKFPKAIYSGSPIPFRFSEKSIKSMELILINDEQTTFEIVEIPSFRGFYSIKTKLQDLEKNLLELIDTHKSHKSELTAYLEVKLDLDAPVSNLADIIRDTLKEIDIKLLSLSYEYKKETEEKIQYHQINFNDSDELFKLFYMNKYPGETEVPTELLGEFKKLKEEIDDHGENTP